jgi:hypothetical protein
MRIRCYLVSLLPFLALVCGCATVHFVDAPGGKSDKGFLYFPPKPYLLVQNGDHGTVASLIALPDVSHPMYVKYEPGWGTMDFSFQTEGGMIKQFGEKTDSKGPETLTALTGGFGSIAGGLKDLGIGDLANAAKANLIQSQGAVTLQLKGVMDAADQINAIISDLKSRGDAELVAVAGRLEQARKELASAAAINVNDSTDILSRLNEARGQVRAVVRQLRIEQDALTKLVSAPLSPPQLVSGASSASGKLTPIIKTLSTFAEVPDPAGLFEIKVEAGQTVFERVRMQ